MEGEDRDRERGQTGGENSAAEGDGDRARYSTLARCASVSSLDESSQRRGTARAQHASSLLSALARLLQQGLLTDVRLRAEPESSSMGLPECDAGGAEVGAESGAESGAEGGAEGVAEGGAGPGEAAAGEAAGAAGGVAAHRAVLAACSPYFRAMFTQFEEASMPTITIKNVDPQALEAIVNYMYNPDALVITEDNVQSLLSAASLLQVAGVAAACCAFLRAALDAGNALGIRAFADMHACRQLAASAAAYIHDHAHEVMQSEEFLQMSAAALAELLASDRLQVPNEEVILDAVIRWMEHDREARADSLGALLEHVRLPLVAQEALVARAAAPPLAGAGLQVKDLLIEAMSFHLAGPGARAAASARSARARPRRAPRRLLLVCGGQAPKAIRDVEALPLAGAGAGEGGGGWRSMAQLPGRRCRAGVAALGARLWLVGGFNGLVRVRAVDVYDAARDAWAPGPPLLARRSTLGVAVSDHVIYAVGGFDGATGLSSAEMLDVREGAWRALPAMATRRSSVGVAVLNGNVYAVGGYDGAARACLASAECFDVVARAWRPAGAMAAPRSGAGVGVLRGALLAVGGHDGPCVRRSAETYTEATGWLPAASMNVARRNAGVAAADDALYAVGGDDGQHNLASVEVYDGNSQAWSVLPEPMSVARSYCGVCVLE